jgi:hypothetical protein
MDRPLEPLETGYSTQRSDLWELDKPAPHGTP